MDRLFVTVFLLKLFLIEALLRYRLSHSKLARLSLNESVETFALIAAASSSSRPSSVRSSSLGTCFPFGHHFNVRAGCPR